MGLWKKISAWWDKDDVEDAAEGVRDDSQAKRDLAAEDYEGRKDDQYLRKDVLAGGTADYERDSEPPADPRP
jgi:hypothetical protein